MKKLTALLLAVLCALSMAACSGEPGETTAPAEPPEPTVTDPVAVVPEVTYPNTYFDPDTCTELLGTWKTPVTLDGSLMNMPDFEGSAAFDVLFTFQQTGRYTINADKSAVDAAISTYEQLLAEYMIDGFYSRFAAEKKLEGLSDTQIEELWAQEQEEVARGEVDAFLDAMALTTRFAAIITHGDFYVQGENLFLSNGDGTYAAYAFTVRNGMLYFTGCSDSGKYQNLWLDFPLPLWPEGSSYADMVPEDLAPADPTFPTVTVPVITDPVDPTDPEPTDPETTAPEGFVTIPTMVGTLWPFPTAPAETEPTVTTPTIQPVDPTESPTEATKPATKPAETKPTDAPATKPTEATTPATTPSTEAPTDPTEEVTEAPTAEPTAAPTEETTQPDYTVDPDDGPIDTDVDWAM